MCSGQPAWTLHLSVVGSSSVKPSQAFTKASPHNFHGKATFTRRLIIIDKVTCPQLNFVNRPSFPTIAISTTGARRQAFHRFVSQSELSEQDQAHSSIMDTKNATTAKKATHRYAKPIIIQERISKTLVMVTFVLENRLLTWRKNTPSDHRDFLCAVLMVPQASSFASVREQGRLYLAAKPWKCLTNSASRP